MSLNKKSFYLPWYGATEINHQGTNSRCSEIVVIRSYRLWSTKMIWVAITYFYNSNGCLWLVSPEWVGTPPQISCPAVDAIKYSFQCFYLPGWLFSLKKETHRRIVHQLSYETNILEMGQTCLHHLWNSVYLAVLITSLTIILDPLGEASLQTLVHWLQASGNVLVPELPWLRSYQLLECGKHLDKVSQVWTAPREQPQWNSPDN